MVEEDLKILSTVRFFRYYGNTSFHYFCGGNTAFIVTIVTFIVTSNNLAEVVIDLIIHLFRFV